MHESVQHGDACCASATGPIRRTPSAADITRVNSFSGGGAGSHAGHYTPYGSVFAAATSQQAAAAMTGSTAAAALGDSLAAPADHHQTRQQFSGRKPPLRQHSYDTLMMQQHWHKQQQQQQRLPPAHQPAAPGLPSVPPSHIASRHPVNCECDGCAAAAQQWMRAHLNHHHQSRQSAAGSGVCFGNIGVPCDADHSHSHNCHQEQQQQHRLAPMFSGPADLGTEAAAAAAGGVLTADQPLPAAAGLRAFSFNGPYSHHSHSVHNCCHNHQQHQQQQQGMAYNAAAAAAAAAAHWHAQQQAAALHPHLQQQQQLQASVSEEAIHVLTPMHSAPAGGVTHTGAAGIPQGLLQPCLFSITRNRQFTHLPQRPRLHWLTKCPHSPLPLCFSPHRSGAHSSRCSSTAVSSRSSSSTDEPPPDSLRPCSHQATATRLRHCMHSTHSA